MFTWREQVAKCWESICEVDIYPHSLQVYLWSLQYIHTVSRIHLHAYSCLFTALCLMLIRNIPFRNGNVLNPSNHYYICRSGSFKTCAQKSHVFRPYCLLHEAAQSSLFLKQQLNYFCTKTKKYEIKTVSQQALITTSSPIDIPQPHCGSIEVLRSAYSVPPSVLQLKRSLTPSEVFVNHLNVGLWHQPRW